MHKSTAAQSLVHGGLRMHQRCSSNATLRRSSVRAAKRNHWDLGRRLLLLVSTLIVVAPVSAAGNYPGRPIQLVVHVEAGSAADIFARELSKVLEPIAKQLVINPMRKQAVIGRSRTTLLRIHT